MEFLYLPSGVLNLRDGPERPLGDRRPVDHAHDLRHPGAGDPLAAGDGGLAGGLAGLEEGLSFERLAKEFDHAGRPGLLRRLGLAPARRDGTDDPVGGHTARQGAHVAVFEGPFGPQCDLDGLSAVGGNGRAVGFVHGDV